MKHFARYPVFPPCPWTHGSHSIWVCSRQPGLRSTDVGPRVYCYSRFVEPSTWHFIGVHTSLLTDGRLQKKEQRAEEKPSSTHTRRLTKSVNAITRVKCIELCRTPCRRTGMWAIGVCRPLADDEAQVGLSPRGASRLKRKTSYVVE